jgi:hypothetical protein
VHEAERRLRWRAEALISSSPGSRPPMDAVDDLTVLGYAALAVAGAGLAADDVVESFLVDVADALVVRGCDWLTPTVLTAESRLPRRDSAVKSVGGYLDGLVSELVERVRGDATFEGMVEARRQISVAAEALGAGDDAVSAFDDALVDAGLMEREK